MPRQSATFRRLKAGAVVLKTASVEAKHGAFWTYPDTGHLAAASVCRRLEGLGLLVSRDSLPGFGGGQTYTYAPPPEKPRHAADRARPRAPRPRRVRVGVDAGQTSVT